MRKALTKLLTSFLATSQAFAVEMPAPSAMTLTAPAPAPQVCYTPEQRQKIADAITALKVCQVDLAARNELIQKNMLTLDGLQPGPSWWQEPHAVVAGVVVSFSVGALVVAYAMRDK